MNYIYITEQLENVISSFMNNKRDDLEVIRKRYKELKDVINNEHKYLSKYKVILWTTFRLYIIAINFEL